MRLWIKRGLHGTPASIQLHSDDLVDDVKDAVFRKYPVALGRTYDAPDVSICMMCASTTKPNAMDAKILAVDEPVRTLLHNNYPNGQTVNDAFVIQVPASQHRQSPYGGPIRSSNSPLSGTLGLMTHDMHDFEYFPETPPVNQHDGTGGDYVNPGKNFVPSNYSSASQSTGQFPQQGTPVVIGADGSVRAAPTLQLNTSRYGVRPQLGPRHATSISSNNSSNYNHRSEGSVTFYPKAVRSQSGQGHVTRPDGLSNANTSIPSVPPVVGHERSMSPTLLPLTEQELSIALPTSRQASSSQPGMPAVLEATVEAESGPVTALPLQKGRNPSPHAGRARRETLTQNAPAMTPQRPGLNRTLTASKLSMVSPATSPHASSNAVPMLETVAKKTEASSPQPTFGVGGLLEGVVPPIVVLIVEDNVINLRILETFMKKRKIRFHSAKNGREAVDKWKKGGVHLVLMDIQMPVMSGIEATKEIRRLERANRIGVFSRQDEPTGSVSEADQLTNLHFKSPVIIVALTASSLQSDRHEALAAGCNDFLTKPVSLVWLEKKVLEWGCMQALIDFEGWRQFRGLSETNNAKSTTPSKTRMVVAANAD